LLNFRISEIRRAYSLQFVDGSKEEIETDFGELKSILVKKVVVSSNAISAASSRFTAAGHHSGGRLFVFLVLHKAAPKPTKNYTDFFEKTQFS
jgi:hypothetical protein